MLLMLSMRLAATIHYLLWVFAPTNILVRRLRTRKGLKWAIPAAVVLVPTYLFAAAIATSMLDDGGPGWLNLVVLICIWNAIKFTGLGLFSPLLLIREILRRRRNRKQAARTVFSPMKSVLR